jgi:hypothetical protein
VGRGSLSRNYDAIISEPYVKIVDFDFTAAYFGFKAYYVFISVKCVIFKRFKIIIEYEVNRHTVFLISPNDTYFSWLKNHTSGRTIEKKVSGA